MIQSTWSPLSARMTHTEYDAVGALPIDSDLDPSSLYVSMGVVA